MTGVTAAFSKADVCACIPKNTAAIAHTKMINHAGIKKILSEVHKRLQNLLADSMPSSSGSTEMTVSLVLSAIVELTNSCIPFNYKPRLNTAIVAIAKSIARDSPKIKFHFFMENFKLLY